MGKRFDPPMPIPLEGIRVGRPVSWQHGLPLAQSINALTLAGGTVCLNCLHLAITSGEGGGSITTGTFRHRVPVRAAPTWRVWVLAYADATHGGRIRINPTIAPLNASDPEWADGRYIEPVRGATDRNTPEPLLFFEQIDRTGGGYSAPDSDHDLGYTVTWDPETGGESITLLTLSCFELDLPESDEHGVDETAWRPRNDIITVDDGSSHNAQVGRLDFALKEHVKPHALHRYQFGIAFPDDDIAFVASSSSHVFTDVFEVPIRLALLRVARTDPGFKTVTTIVRAYGRNSDTSDGLLEVETNEGDWSLTGFPVGSFGWVTVTDAAGRVLSTGNRATPSVTGFQDGTQLDSDTVTQETMTTEETVAAQVRAKASEGAAANTLDILTIEIVQIVTAA